jgi:uncharacterized protein (TIGR02099 family)
MDPVTPPPNLLTPCHVRLTARLARALLWLLVAFWLLVGLSYGLLQGWIVPRIGEFRPRLEIEASRALGVPVRIGNISAHSGGLIPSFELNEVSLLDRQGRIALRLPRVVLALSPRSLWSLGFEQLVIDGAELDIRRTADGQLQFAGLDLSDITQGHTAFADWAFEQTELVLRGGLLRWTDETRGAPPLVLTDVVAVLRNPGKRHLLRIDATPPTAWGERFSVRARLRQPLLSGSGSSWKTWSGQLYSEFSRADVSQLKQYISPDAFGIDLSSGQGALRLWADLTAGQLSGVTGDVALAGVSTRLASDLPQLMLTSLDGRFSGQQRVNGFNFKTESLSFKADDGLVWPGGNVALTHTNAEGHLPSKTELKADKLDLSTLARIAQRLPLDAATHTLLDSFAPRGLVEHLEAAWQGELAAPLALTARGRVTGLALAAAAASASTPTHPLPGRPGLQNAAVDFNLTQDGGQAQVLLTKGTLEFPGIFEQPRLLFNTLSSDVQWKHDGPRLELKLKKLRFANADAVGQAEVRWTRAEASTADASSAPSHNPGVLDLQGSISRGDASQVHRYLPLVLPASARHYVRDAVQQGRLSEVKFKVKGNLLQLPFVNSQSGDFLVTAKATNVRYAYVPPALSMATGSVAAKPWPVLEGLQGELIFNRQGLEVRDAQGRVAGLDGLQLTRASAHVPDLAQPVVEVNTSIKGPLAQGLQFVNMSPVSGLLGDALKQSTANGPADFTMRLLLPLFNLDKSSLQGSLTLPGNDVQFTSNTPVLGRLKGALNFTENSFRVSNAQARMLGGDMRFEGGMRASATAATTSRSSEPLDPPILFRGQGTVSAEGLQQARELGSVASLASRLSGRTAYSASLGFRRGNAELSVNSSLLGMALNFPAPLTKAAGETLPLQFDQALLRESLAPGKIPQDQLSLSLGRLANARYVRDLRGGQPKVLHGSIAVGLVAGESAAQPANAVAANINLQRADVDAWRSVLDAAASLDKTAGQSISGMPSRAAANTASAAADYLPSMLALRATELTFEGYKLRKLVLGASREGGIWRSTMDADELSGYVEFDQPTAAPGGAGGRLYARLSRLRLGASTAREVETLLEGQPTAIPALDIVVEDMELKGKRLGRIEVEAVNRGAQLLTRDNGVREWRLNRLNIISPDAIFSASGNWAAVTPLAPSRRVLMDFKLDINNSGDLLKRLGMDGLVRRGKGKLEGQVSWLGSPLSLDYPSLGGQFKVNVESGQFLKAEPGIAKLLGVLSLQALPRRLTLDFRDVFSEGFAFDLVRGDVTIEEGQARTNNLQMKGLSAAVLMDGSADIARETQDLRVVVIPEINAGTASLIASAINPAIGLGTFLAQLFFRQPLTEAATQEFHIDGPWSDPRITRVERKPVTTGPGNTMKSNPP